MSADDFVPRRRALRDLDAREIALERERHRLIALLLANHEAREQVWLERERLTRR